MAAKTQKCDFCGKDSSLQCGKCKKQRYCSQECQKEDWRVHKICCNPLSDFKIQKHGSIHSYGLFATRKFNTGDLIYGEAPLLSCSFGEEAEGFAEIPADFASKFILEPPIETVEQFEDVMVKYAYRDQLANTRRLYKYSSFINHRCLFNVLVIMQFGGNAHCRAARSIEAGEELTTSYISASFANKKVRWEHLKGTYDVSECHCPECSAEGPDFEQDDGIRGALHFTMTSLSPGMFVFGGSDKISMNAPIVKSVLRNMLETTNLLYGDLPDSMEYNPYFLAVSVPVMMFFKLCLDDYLENKEVRSVIFELSTYIKKRLSPFEKIDPTISIALNHVLKLSGPK